jgi:hypothetical protein
MGDLFYFLMRERHKYLLGKSWSAVKLKGLLRMGVSIISGMRMLM